MHLLWFILLLATKQALGCHNTHEITAEDQRQWKENMKVLKARRAALFTKYSVTTKPVVLPIPSVFKGLERLRQTFKTTWDGSVGHCNVHSSLWTMEQVFSQLETHFGMTMAGDLDRPRSNELTTLFKAHMDDKAMIQLWASHFMAYFSTNTREHQKKKWRQQYNNLLSMSDASSWLQALAQQTLGAELLQSEDVQDLFGFIEGGCCEDPQDSGVSTVPRSRLDPEDDDPQHRLECLLSILIINQVIPPELSGLEDIVRFIFKSMVNVCSQCHRHMSGRFVPLPLFMTLRFHGHSSLAVSGPLDIIVNGYEFSLLSIVYSRVTSGVYRRLLDSDNGDSWEECHMNQCRPIGKKALFKHPILVTIRITPVDHELSLSNFSYLNPVVYYPNARISRAGVKVRTDGQDAVTPVLRRTNAPNGGTVILLSKKDQSISLADVLVIIVTIGTVALALFLLHRRLNHSVARAPRRPINPSAAAAAAKPSLKTILSKTGRPIRRIDYQQP